MGAHHGSKMGRMRKTLLLVLVALSVGACGGGGDDDAPPAGASLFSPAITEVAFEIDYATGAEPYTGGIGGAFGDTWELFQTNAERLFQDDGKTLTVPTTLAEMEELTDVPAGPYTADAILALAEAHRDQASAGATARFYVIFLDGYYDDGSGPDMNVLGVSLGRSGVIAMFKPVIASTGSALTPNVERFVEQSTLVHEFGHAVGLVDNGIPMVAAHKDTAHGAHCDNDRCTMYWANEGAADAAQFVRDYVVSGSTILFDAACLADVDAIIAASGA
jgi:predicted Zn-dependent protease